MQNPHVKFLKTKNTFHLFYYEQSGIFCRYHTEEGWTAPKKIIDKVSPFFSLCHYAEKTHLLYSNMEGQLFIAASKDFDQWEHHSMAEENLRGNRFFLLPMADSYHMIHHQPTESTGIDALVYSVFRDGRWEKPYQIDRFMPMPKTPFLARRLSQEHIILYYRTGRNIISAREMLLEPCTMGSLTPLIQTPSPCVDISIVNDNERIHMLYIVRGMFRTQVVYQYKHTSAISTPRVLWEDNNCDNCLVYLQNEKVILMWTVSGQPMRCISENDGNSFGSIEKYTEKFPAKCIKAELIGADGNDFQSTECYADSQNGFLPAVFPISPPSVTQKTVKRAIPHPNLTKAYTALQESHKQQVEELSSLLAQRSDEIAAVNARWKNQIEKLEAELSSLRKENEALKISFDKTEKDT